MSIRNFIFGTVFLFGVIGFAAWLKGGRDKSAGIQIEPTVEIPLLSKSDPVPKAPPVRVILEPKASTPVDAELPDADRIAQLFATDSSKLGFVETVSYTSRVPWLKGRPAWIADYASHYETSRHFIARSLNKKADYLTQKISPGDRFNVFRKDKNIQFYLLIDLSRCRLWFYGLDVDVGDKILLKTYRVGLGRPDSARTSGSLTPLGKYTLGQKVAIYKPGITGIFQEKKTEMIQVFGTRWIPFEKELEGCTEPAKGFGIHGAPWIIDPVSGNLVEDLRAIGSFDSDGCIRLAAQDIEELFAIILTKPTTVELVKDFYQAKLLGSEKGKP